MHLSFGALVLIKMEEVFDILADHKRKIEELIGRIDELEKNKRHRPNEKTVPRRSKQKILDQIEKVRSDGTTIAQHFEVQYFDDYINFIVDDIEIGYNDKDEFYLRRVTPYGEETIYDDKMIRGTAILLRGRILESPAKKDTSKKFVSYFIDSSAFSNVVFNTGEDREFWKGMSVYSGKYKTSLVEKDKGERDIGAITEDSLLLCKGINFNRKPNLLKTGFTDYTVTKILYVLDFE